jgi:hypothetical protein
MYTAPEGADAANVTPARSGRLSSMVRCAHSYVHNGPSSASAGACPGRADGFVRRDQRDEQLIQSGDDIGGLADPGAGLRSTKSR